MFPSNYYSYRKVLVFDVETTGLIPKINPITKQPPLITECPYIIQLSFVKYNIYEHVIEEGYNTYININSEVVIDPKITELTGITRELCDKGKDIVDVLEKIYEEYKKSDCIVAHNLEFDSKMLKIEIERNKEAIMKRNPDILNMFNTELNKFFVEKFCTMMSTIHTCGIVVTNVDKYGKTYKYKKFPKLAETYEHLFREVPKNLHNSMMDTLVCLRCYLKIRHDVIVHNEKFAFWVDKYVK